MKEETFFMLIMGMAHGQGTELLAISICDLMDPGEDKQSWSYCRLLLMDGSKIKNLEPS